MSGSDCMTLPPVTQLAIDGTDDEICLVLLSGDARITAGPLDTGMLKGRASVFDKVAPHAVYVPMKTAWRVEAGTDVELAVCRAPGTEGTLPPRLIGADSMPLETRGTGTNTRHVCNILPETEPADSLACCGGDHTGGQLVVLPAAQA